MKNREKFAKEILDIACNGSSIAMDFDGNLVPCSGLAWIFGKTWYVELNAAKMVNSFCGQIMMSGSGN